MRMGRLLAEEGAVEACYYCVTRVVERRFAFGEREKEKFVEILRAYEEFCGVQVLTFCIMNNHVHVLVHVPKRPEQMPDDAELVRLVGRADLSYPASELERQLAEMRKAGDDAGAERLRERFLRRMWNLASFMQGIKQRFSQWFNGKHPGNPSTVRGGTGDMQTVEELWALSFRSAAKAVDQRLSVVKLDIE